MSEAPRGIEMYFLKGFTWIEKFCLTTSCKSYILSIIHIDVKYRQMCVNNVATFSKKLNYQSYK